MRRDPTEFRERFKRWKAGERVYDSGWILPAYDDGTTPDDPPTQLEIHDTFNAGATIGAEFATAAMEENPNALNIRASDYNQRNWLGRWLLNRKNQFRNNANEYYQLSGFTKAEELRTADMLSNLNADALLLLLMRDLSYTPFRNMRLSADRDDVRENYPHVMEDLYYGEDSDGMDGVTEYYGRVGGGFFPVSAVKHNSEIPTTPIHELAHAATANHPVLEVAIYNIINNANKQYNHKYWDKPTEIYSRLMEARHHFNLAPNYKVTIEDLKNMRKAMEGVPDGGRNGFNLLNRYDDDTLLKLFNDVAMVDDIGLREGEVRADLGRSPLRIPKFDTGVSPDDPPAMKTLDQWANGDAAYIGNNTYTDQCAQFANALLNNLGYNTSGNAWNPNQRSLVYSGYDVLNRPLKYDRTAVEAYNHAATKKFYDEFDSKTLDQSKVYTVNMFYNGSSQLQNAYNEARDGVAGSHTGVVRYNKKDKDWEVVHNIHGKVYVDKFTKIQDQNAKYGITAIYEPRSNNAWNNAWGSLMHLFGGGYDFGRSPKIIKHL